MSKRLERESIFAATDSANDDKRGLSLRAFALIAAAAFLFGWLAESLVIPTSTHHHQLAETAP